MTSFVLDTVVVEAPAEHVAVVRLARPRQANALSTQMGRDLCTAWQRVNAAVDEGLVRVVVLAAAGEGAFCGGADLKERDGMDDDAWRAQHAIFEDAVRAQRACRVPVIAAVSGHAYAGGLELVLACDFAIGVDGARFAFTEVTIGLVPGLGGTQLLARAVGERRAKELILTGRAFTAAEALAWGVLQRVCTRADLDDVVIAVATTIAANAPLAVAAAKRAIHDGLDTDLAAALRLELAAYDTLVPTDDRRVGVRSFRTREKPRFSGR